MITMFGELVDLSSGDCLDHKGHVFSYSGPPQRDDLEHATRIIETPAMCNKCGATCVIRERYPHIPIRTA